MDDVLVIICLEDWEGIYYKGSLLEEAHQIRRSRLVHLMKTYNVFDIEEKYLNTKGHYFVQDTGNLPDTYEEIIEYILE